MSEQQKIATVFGGTGFVGRLIVRDLARRGYTVKVASRAPESAFFLRTAGHVGQIVPFACDYKNPASIGEAVRGADIAVNCIGILHEKRKGDFQRIHTDLPRTIGAACAFENVKRFIHISALGLESDKSRYALTKLDGERAAREAFPAVTILRPSVIFGADDNFFNMFARLSLVAPFLPLIGGGHTRFQPVFAGDVAEAALVAAQTPAAAGQVFELGGPNVVTFKDIYEILFKYTGRSKPLVSLPWGVARLQAFFMGMLPEPPLTCDQILSLKSDHIVSDNALTLADLGIAPTSMDVILPTYLASYQPGGKFAAKRAA